MNTLDACLERLYRQHIPVIRAHSTADALWIAEQLIQVGFHCVEFTLTTPDILDFFNGPRPEDWPSEILVGLGTLSTATQIEALAEVTHPPDFVASPGLLPAPVFKKALKILNDQEILFMSGAATPTEVLHALHSGIKAIKWFPAEPLGGTRTLQTIKAPFPEAKIIPFGGLQLAQAKAYWQAGAWAVGLGTSLMPSTVDLAQRNETSYQNYLYTLKNDAMK
jgi:2-dehydro-3-deoxyphosphogluconate aldolase/(4S)-4-hydroxy-2-oxoglutarate aldolase